MWWDMLILTIPYTFDGARYSAPVGNYASGISFYGLFDMVGNVSEWCYDWYSNDANKPNESTEFGLRKSYRGGSFKTILKSLQLPIVSLQIHIA